MHVIPFEISTIWYIEYCSFDYTVQCWLRNSMEGKFISKEEDFMHVILSCIDKYSLQKGNWLFVTGLVMATQARVLNRGYLLNYRVLIAMYGVCIIVSSVIFYLSNKLYNILKYVKVPTCIISWLLKLYLYQTVNYISI